VTISAWFARSFWFQASSVQRGSPQPWKCQSGSATPKNQRPTATPQQNSIENHWSRENSGSSSSRPNLRFRYWGTQSK